MCHIRMDTFVDMVMHQSIPPSPSQHCLCLGWQIPGDGEEKRGQMPRPPSTVQHFFIDRTVQ